MQRSEVCRQRPLASSGEKRLDHRRTILGKNTRRNFNFVIEVLTGKNLKARARRASLGIVRSIDRACYSSLNHRPSAHAARFDGDVKSCAGESVIVYNARSLAKNNNFRVSRRVAIADGTVAGARDNFPVQYQHSSDRNFSRGPRRAGLLESFLHKADIGIHIAVRVTRKAEQKRG